MNKRTQELLWIGAFRYYLGRRTYAVGDFCAALVPNWSLIPERARVVIGRELDEAFMLDDRDRANGDSHPYLGMDMDRHEWEKVRAAIRECAA